MTGGGCEEKLKEFLEKKRKLGEIESLRRIRSRKTWRMKLKENSWDDYFATTFP